MAAEHSEMQTEQNRERAVRMHNATVIMMHVMVVVLGLLMGLVVLNA